ncbi:hypothetical protein [Thalassotalea loyana]|uniref:hypothetical protein n=1 Tax=Thalassotalea loyana TaxID=280483 RepID=UPI0024E11A7C|nr:hypothetical protein [Thalassotalea loyana]
MTNCCKFGAQTLEQVQKQTWHKLDCLTRYLLKGSKTNQQLRKWFNEQPEDWQQARRPLFETRLKQRW